jgi:hypothetical protein
MSDPDYASRVEASIQNRDDEISRLEDRILHLEAECWRMKEAMEKRDQNSKANLDRLQDLLTENYSLSERLNEPKPPRYVILRGEGYHPNILPAVELGPMNTNDDHDWADGDWARAYDTHTGAIYDLCDGQWEQN